MCPLRIILVFLSASLAGYFAWKTVRSSDVSPFDAAGDESAASKSAVADLGEKDTSFDLRKVIGDGFWVFVDMASGRYLWRNLKEAGKER